ncbi:FAD-dependent monooxygenase [Micrococcaceae bacterium RIT802]|nr:FAD-dependent monooxygenase [Micrococcaceae bacterium RIT 802]
MHVAVIGGGIGGLCAAIGLQRHGAEVEVFERSAVLAPVGAGLSLFGNGLAALDAIGLGPRFRDLTDPHGAVTTGGQRRPDGTWLARLGPGLLPDLRVIHRADLHELLVSALEPGTLHLGSTCAAVPGGGRELDMADAGGKRRQRYDLVVAADGIRSSTRAGWPGDPGLRYSGYSAWRGVTRGPVDLGGEAGETWGRGLRFGMAPLVDGRVYWFAVATMPADAVVDDEFAEVRRLFGRWHDPIPRLLDGTDPAAVVRHPIHDLAKPLPTFRRGRTLLLGDAAHAMTPDLGQGGGQAMEDAATLAALLAPVARNQDPDLDAALVRYDSLRRKRTQPMARAARAVGRVAQLGFGPAVVLRDTAMRITPASAMAGRIRAVQRWEPPTP